MRETPAHRARNLHIRWRNSHVRRQKGRCFYCGAPFVPPAKEQASNRARQATLDHLVPLSRGGADHYENTVAACHRCNQRKGSMTVAEFRAVTAAVTPPHLPIPSPANAAVSAWPEAAVASERHRRLRIAIEETMRLTRDETPTWHRLDVPSVHATAAATLHIAVTLPSGLSWALCMEHASDSAADVEATTTALLTAILRACAVR